MKNYLSRLNPDSLALLRSIGLLAQAQGVEAYLVGGPVRDLILKRPCTDLDITVEGNGIRLAEHFAAGPSAGLVWCVIRLLGQQQSIYPTVAWLILPRPARKHTRGAALFRLLDLQALNMIFTVGILPSMPWLLPLILKLGVKS